MFKLSKKKDNKSSCKFTTKPGVTFSSITEKNIKKYHKECRKEKMEETIRAIQNMKDDENG